MAVQKAARTGHNHIRDWWAGVLTNCGDPVAQGAVSVQLRNFEVHHDCLAGTEEPAQPSEAEMSDITAALTDTTALCAMLVTDPLP